jgi:hypothetical protein
MHVAALFSHQITGHGHFLLCSLKFVIQDNRINPVQINYLLVCHLTKLPAAAAVVESLLNDDFSGVWRDVVEP